MEEFYQNVGQRYLSLSEDEKEIVRRLKNSPDGEVIMKVLGPGITNMMIQLAKPKTVTSEAVEQAVSSSSEITKGLMGKGKKRTVNRRKKPYKNKRSGLGSK